MKIHMFVRFRQDQIKNKSLDSECSFPVAGRDSSIDLRIGGLRLPSGIPELGYCSMGAVEERQRKKE